MTTLTDLSALLTRLEGANGPDRELDAWLHCLRFGWKFTRMPGPREGSSGFFAIEDSQGIRCHDYPHRTASLDATIALVERVLPEAFWQIGHDEDDPAWFRVRLLPFLQPVIQAEGPTPALALLIAMCRAFQPQGEVEWRS